MRFRLPVLLLAVVTAQAELIDRIAATVGRQVITESQIDEEILVTAFLDGKLPDWSEQNRTRTANRLVDQVLVRREIEATRFPQAPAEEGAHLLAQLKAATASDFAASLKAAHLTESLLSQHFRGEVEAVAVQEEVDRADVNETTDGQSPPFPRHQFRAGCRTNLDERFRIARPEKLHGRAGIRRQKHTDREPRDHRHDERRRNESRNERRKARGI